MPNAKSTAAARLRRIQELCAAADQAIETSSEQRRLLEAIAAEAEELAQVIRRGLHTGPRRNDN